MDLNSPVKLSAINSLINARLMGDENYLLKGINEIHMVRNGDLTFVDHPKYYNKALNSAATVIIINKEVEVPEGKHLFISDDPFRDYNFLTNHYRPFKNSVLSISASAKIGEGTRVQPGAFIGNHVVIGKNCLIHANASIGDHCIVGNDCVIHSGAVIGADAFYFKKYADRGYVKMHSCGRVVIGNRVEIGACTTIDRGVSGDTTIGDGSKFDNHVHVGHDTAIGKNCLFAAQVGIAGVAKIEDDVILWGQVGVNKDLVIGKGAVVYAQSGVASSIEGGKIYFGSPVLEAKEKMKELVWMKRLKELFEKK
ncbi:MAG: UDP-3-O-(3-hydroxymyristoyl)glucosamine N-acyltransferase [Chitinophagales bacterium]|nr:UDP-3-O-(3-hydroxymyristoyl)glucosamine N-acyltransferase [Chitinophagales bacterium]